VPPGQVESPEPLIAFAARKMLLCAMVASEVAEHSANTAYVRFEPSSLTLASQPRPTSPVLVLSVEPVSSTGPLACTTSRGVLLLAAPTPPPTTRRPCG